MADISSNDIERLARRIVELGGSTGVTQRCVPLAAGGLDSDLRVNYEFGLVLGVDEFRQEQFYHLQKSYLHNRALHGCGVASGLDIDLQRTPDDDIRVNVHAGIGVDQCGRMFIIRNDQCAYLRAWLEHNRQSVALAAGALTLYVIGTYDECPDALVAIAGQPCASSEQSLAYSRIRDSFNITLRAQPPAMPTWAAIDRFAAMMTRVRIITDLPPAESDEPDIIARVRVLDDPAALAVLEAELGPSDYLKLPAEAINEALDRIFMVWVTEVRPRLTPSVIDGCGDADPVETGILLGRLDIVLDDVNAPIQFTFNDGTPERSLDGRPYLLQTQLIQELLFLGVGNDEQPHDFADLWVQDENNVFIWIHHPDSLIFANANMEGVLELRVNNELVRGEIRVFNELGLESLNWFVVTTETRIPAGARVEVRFLLLGWWLRGEAEQPITLIERVDRFNYVGRDDDTITVYTFADRLAEVRDFVVPSLFTDGERTGIRLWFPFDAPMNFDQAPDPLNLFRVIDPANGEAISFSIEPLQPLQVWLVMLNAENLRGLLQRGLLLQFDANLIRVSEESNLLTAMTNGQYSYTGYDNDGSISVPFIIEPPPPNTGLTEEQVRIIIESSRTITVPLANLQFMSTNFDNIVTFELWFHLDLQWQEYRARILENLGMLVLAEVMENGDPQLVELRWEARRFEDRPNVFEVNVITDRGPERMRFLRFIFPIDEQMPMETSIGQIRTLREFIEGTRTRFTGYYDIEEFTGRPAVVLYGRAITQREG